MAEITKREKTVWPLYQQVKQLIIRRIQAGHWLPEAKIPSENELVETLGMSRMTVNRSIRELTSEGLLFRQRGSGTYVAPRKPQMALLEIRSIADEIKERGGIHACSIHLLREEKASIELVEELGLGKSTSVFHSITVHREDGLPVQLADRYVNPIVVPDYLKQDFTVITPSEYLLSVAPLTEVELTIEALLPDQEICRLLEIDEKEPCLVIRRTTWSKKTVATKSKFISPTSRYHIGGRFKPKTSSQQILA